MVAPAAALVVLTLVGAALPHVVRRSHRWLHLLVALVTGMFLGMVFLHLLPALFGEHGVGEGLAPVDHGGGTPSDLRPGLAPAWRGGLVLVGVLVPFVLQNLLIPGGKGTDRHVSTSWGALFGLSLHAFAEGLALGAWAGPEAQSGALGLASAVLFPILVHKLAEGFSLSTVFLLSGTGPVRLALILAAFACVTPIGLVFGNGLLHTLGRPGVQGLSALAAGTFLFVAGGDLLPEVFHGRTDVGKRLGVLGLGVGLAALLHGLEL